MAVQAQYPSNILLLNRNNQEGKNTIGNEYSLQQQKGPGGDGGGGGGGATSSLFDHQPHMLFNSRGGNNNTRKRSRELISTINNGGPSMALQQSQTSNQIINLSQLHTQQNHPNNVVSTGLRLAFGDQLQQQKHPLHHQTQQQQLHMLSSQSSQKSSVFVPFLSDDLASHMKQQREEIDNFINFQGEQLRRALAEKRQAHFRTLLTKMESSIAVKLREKEAEVEKAFRRNAELESHAAQLSAELQSSQARAKEHEAIVASLQAQLQQAMVRGSGAEEREDMVAEDAESGYIDLDRVVELDGPGCKACGRRVASVVLLPCRHLCLCVECDSVARCCPLCYTFRNSSVEVIMG